MLWDGRTKNGKAARRGYTDGAAGRAVPAAERQADTWPFYEKGYAAAKIDQANHQPIAARRASVTSKT